MPIPQQLPIAIYEQEVPPIVSTLLLPTRYKQGLVLNLGHSPLYRHFCKSYNTPGCRFTKSFCSSITILLNAGSIRSILRQCTLL